MRQSLKKGASFRRHANEAQAAKLSTLLNRFFTLNPKRDEVMVRGSKERGENKTKNRREVNGIRSVQRMRGWKRSTRDNNRNVKE